MQSNFFISQFKRITNSCTDNTNIIIYVLICVLSLDTLLNQTGDLIGDQLKSSAGTVLFITLSLITLVAQILVLQFVGKNSAEIQRKIKSIRLLHKFVTIIQYIIIGIFVFLIFEIILKQNYLPVSSMLVTFLSYMQTTIL
ncbi:MAG: hypothetical protein ACPKPY_00210, partial [Nitrososphaeraceae archaeon]